MTNDLGEVRRRSGVRNPDLDINKTQDSCEVFVHHLRVPGHKEIEVHMPIEWVSIGGDSEIVFSAEGQQLLDEAEVLMRQHGPSFT